MAKNAISYPKMREFFHVPETYFLSHSVGCLSKQSHEAISEGLLAPWISGENWSDWMQTLQSFRAGLAALLQVSSVNICPQVNISSALTKILFSLPKTEGRNVILLSKQDFPTIGFVAKQAERLGYHLIFIDGDPADGQRWKDAIDETVAFVLATHALSNTSQLLPIEDICAAARAVGALTIVDVAQSLGAVPVDVVKWNPDFVVGTGVKFLCFGPGACFLYASDSMLRRCQPLDVGWFSHENPFEMDIENFRYASDAMKFFGGTPSPAPYVLASHAMKAWDMIGLEKVHDAIQRNLSYLHESLPKHAIVSPREQAKRGASFVVKTSYAELVKSELQSERIFFDQRREGYRFSVHGYVSAQDIETLAAILSSA